MKPLCRLALLAVLALPGCGGGDDERAASRSAPARVTPVPSTDAPLPSPTPGIHASPAAPATPTPTATATATATPETGGAEAGDEEGIEVAVRVVVSEDGIAVDPAQAPAFLPLRFEAVNRLNRAVSLVVLRAAGDGEPLARLTVAAGSTASARSGGVRPGAVDVLSPDLGPDATARLAVVRSG